MSRQKDQPIRIWYQSFVDPAEQAPYMDRLRARLAQVASAGTSLNVTGLVPSDRYFHSITEFRCADRTIRDALAAERAGYDAFVAVKRLTGIGTGRSNSVN